MLDSTPVPPFHGYAFVAFENQPSYHRRAQGHDLRNFSLSNKTDGKQSHAPEQPSGASSEIHVAGGRPVMWVVIPLRMLSHMNDAKVFLIGGAPGAGKTTLGCALAARIGGSSVTIDDLMTVAKTATTPESHPDLYLFTNTSYLEYFTNCSIDQLKRDAERQYEAMWPFVKNLITKHFNWTTTPIVLDGCHLRPHLVAELDNDNLDSNWLFISPESLEKRERENDAWTNGSSDPDRMFRNFMARSLWYNDLIKQEAEELEMTVIHQTGGIAVDDLCDAILEKKKAG